MRDDDDILHLIEELYAGLPRMTYHAYLGVNEYADLQSLRDAFRDRGSRMHPDRFRGDGAEVQAKAHAVFRRMNEAFRVLSNPALRDLYREARAAGKNRLEKGPRGEWIDPPSAVARPEEAVVNPEARRFYLAALDAERLGEPARAWLHLKQALAIEPANATLLEKWEKYK